ncbi:MAG: hypothetical protein LBB79_01330 [Prevotellaceae bacterium]|jgi:hypothetical protein|nr:hypothetical protein [Prevotellaceae bacterium]
MKKSTFYGKMVAFLAIALGLMVALAVFLPSCDKDEDNNPDGDLYKPSENMTVEEIRTLLEEVNDNMASVRQISAEQTSIITETGYGGTMTYNVRATAQVNLDAKKELIMFYEDGELCDFTYTENGIAYDYEYEKQSSEPEERKSYKVSDAYWNHSEVFDEVVDDFVDVIEVSEWKVEGDAFVGSTTRNSRTEKYTFLLTSSKKISNIKYESEYKYESNSSSSSGEIKYTYSANPAFPNNYDKSDFPLATQYSVKVVWGKGQDESTFYTEPGISFLYAYEVLDYAPKVQGEEPEGLYKDQAFTQKTTSPIDLSDNNTVLYVKWVNDSGSTSKSKSRPAAKSLLKRLSRNLEGAEAQ